MCGCRLGPSSKFLLSTVASIDTNFYGTKLRARQFIWRLLSSGRFRDEQDRAKAEPSDGGVPRFETVLRPGTRRDIGPTGRAAREAGRSPWRSAVVRRTPRDCRRSTIIPISAADPAIAAAPQM